MGHLLPLRARAAAPVLWFGGLALLVAGPLLGHGHLLLLDFPAGPHFPRATLTPVAGTIASGEPLLALHALLGQIWEPLTEKAFLLAPVALGGTGLYRFARCRLGLHVVGALYAGTLYCLNPFVLDRYLAGQLYFLLGYGLLPWALPIVLEAARRPRAWLAVPIALWLSVLSIASIHWAGIYLLLVVAALAAARGPVRTRIGVGTGVLTAAVLLGAFWLIPAIAYPLPGGASASELATYASAPHGWGALAPLLAMHGFWLAAGVSPPELYAALVPILVLAGLGLIALTRQRAARPFAIGLTVSAAAGLVLAASTALPGPRGIAAGMFATLPPLAVYREPQKLIALTILAYALLGGAGIDRVIDGGSRRRICAATACATAAILASGYGLAWGFLGRVHLTQYPASWSQAERRLEQAPGPGSVLVLPWRPYAAWSFSDGRVVAQPAGSFFARPVVAAAGDGFEPRHDAIEPAARIVLAALARRGQTKSFGRLVAPAGVRFVAWLREADWQRYRFLTRQHDLHVLYAGPSLTVYENSSWQSGVGPRPRSSAASLAGAAISLLALFLALLAGLARQQAADNEADPAGGVLARLHQHHAGQRQRPVGQLPPLAE